MAVERDMCPDFSGIFRIFPDDDDDSQDNEEEEEEEEEEDDDDDDEDDDEDEDKDEDEDDDDDDDDDDNNNGSTPRKRGREREQYRTEERTSRRAAPVAAEPPRAALQLGPRFQGEVDGRDSQAMLPRALPSLSTAVNAASRTRPAPLQRNASDPPALSAALAGHIVDLAEAGDVPRLLKSL